MLLLVFCNLSLLSFKSSFERRKKKTFFLFHPLCAVQEKRGQNKSMPKGLLLVIHQKAYVLLVHNHAWICGRNLVIWRVGECWVWPIHFNQQKIFPSLMQSTVELFECLCRRSKTSILTAINFLSGRNIIELFALPKRVKALARAPHKRFAFPFRANQSRQA